MLSHEDEKQSVRRVCKNVSVRTLLQSFAVLPGKEEMAPLTGRATWMDGEHLLENTAYREKFVLQAHISHPLPSLQSCFLFQILPADTQTMTRSKDVPTESDVLE